MRFPLFFILGKVRKVVRFLAAFFSEYLQLATVAAFAEWRDSAEYSLSLFLFQR